MNNRTSRQLVVKCSLDSWNKKITFDSARNCTYELLRQKVEQCYSLSPTSFAITYKDDDGEITTITNDTDLTEAIQYFHAGDDVPLSSAASILSGRSFGSRKVTLKVQITVDYDGPSLSDTSSLISLDEYRGRNGSQQSFSFDSPVADDDSVTISSRDNSGPSVSSWSAVPSNGRSGDGIDSLVSSSSGSRFTLVSDPAGDRGPKGSTTLVSPSQRLPDPSAVLQRLKLQEEAENASNVHYNSLARNSRGEAWLREQNERHIHTMLGVLPESSASMADDVSLDPQMNDEDGLSGDLALERDPRGRYYYNYTSAGSSILQVHGSGYDDGPPSRVVPISQRTRPSSMHLNWLANQQIQTQKARGPKASLTYPNLQPWQNFSLTDGNPKYVIDRELLQYLPPTVPPQDSLTACSNCGTLLDTIRYVCSTCGEKHPVLSNPLLKGKGKVNTFPSFGHLPQSRYTHPISSSPGNPLSSQMHPDGSTESLPAYQHLPSLPSSSTLAVSEVSSLKGFELCSNCMESAGVHHAIEAASSTSPVMPTSVNGDAQAASQWRRAAPKKGELRHAFLQKYWSHDRWEEVEQDEVRVSKCSTCQATTCHKRYKCVSCPNINLCRACYSQVHETHPSHAFLNVPDRLPLSHNDPDFPLIRPPDPQDEEPLKHPGVKCTHCLQDIVGARFHCAICAFVDICANCESAGLPGNLDSADGGHNSSHILIKIPYPLEVQELESASRRAINLWTRGDAASVGLSASWPKASSVVSSYARTVVGNASRRAPAQSNDHRLLCNSCGLNIIGIRYQCANCPTPRAYNLCENCEQRSYLVHDPMHIFFKLPRPVLRPIESFSPMVPILYQTPVGSLNPFVDTNEPTAYLNNLKHTNSLCDRCIKVIVGAWFRCAYCARDLCDTCEAVDTHNDSHVFLVFKSLVDMKILQRLANLETPTESPPIIPYAVY